MKLKTILAGIFTVLIFGTWAQNLKINQAEFYYNAYRFAEALPIYEEMIRKNQIDPIQEEILFRHAVQSAENAHNFSSAYGIMNRLSEATQLTEADNFQLLRYALMSGNVARAEQIMEETVSSDKNTPYGNLLALWKNKYKTLSKKADRYTINAVSFNSEKGDFATSFHPDGLIFTSSRDNSSKEWSYDRSAFLNTYLFHEKENKIVQITAIKSKQHDGTACYDHTNQIWFYAKNFTQKEGLITTGLFIYDEKTKLETAFPHNLEGSFTAQPYYDEKREILWFSSDRPGGQGKADIWCSAKTKEGWSIPVNAGNKINTPENEMFPSLFERTLYFSSNGLPGFGGLDIFSVDLNDKTPKPENMGVGLNSNADDFSLILKKGGKEGYFSSSRNDFIDRIYTVKINRLSFLFKAEITSLGKEKINYDALPIVLSKNGKITDTLYADASGNLTFEAEEESDYKFEINGKRFLPSTTNYTTVGKKESDTTVKKIELMPKYVEVNTVIIDEKTNHPIAGAKIEIKDPTTGKSNEYLSDQNGKIKIELERNLNFGIHTSKKGYFDSDIALSTENKNIQMDKNIELKMIVKGATLEVQNIFYDLGKSTLRPESKTELDKLVHFLKENPTLKIELSAHTDSRGSDAKNLSLSQARAQSCVNYLISQGVNKQSIVAKGYGETKLINRCKNGITCSEEEHQQNRRTEIKIL